MAEHDVFRLFKGLRAARDRAQLRSDRRQQRLLEELIEIGRDGKPQSLCWVSRLPSGDGSHRTHELIRLPWASLRSVAPHYVATASISIDCHVAPEKMRSEEATGDLTLVPVQERKAEAATAHRLEINLGSDDEDLDEIRLDGLGIKAAGSDEITLPPDLFEQLSVHRQRRNRLSIWKTLTVMALIVLLALGILWFLGVFSLP